MSRFLILNWLSRDWTRFEVSYAQILIICSSIYSNDKFSANAKQFKYMLVNYKFSSILPPLYATAATKRSLKTRSMNYSTWRHGTSKYYANDAHREDKLFLMKQRERRRPGSLPGVGINFSELKKKMAISETAERRGKGTRKLLGNCIHFDWNFGR